MPHVEGIARVNSADLYYRDSKGDGAPIVLLHPLTGSALCWQYQESALANAGYRVIAYSRRGHYGSSPAPSGEPGEPAKDLEALADFLGLEKFVTVACAAGTAVAIDFAIDNSERLLAQVLAAGSYLETEEPEYQALKTHVRVEGFHDMPLAFRELSPSYRAANVEGTLAWESLERRAREAGTKSGKASNRLNWDALSKISASTLFIAGGADLAAPPPMMAMFAQHVEGAELVVLPDVGHSVYWEQPDIFNKHVLDFLGKRLAK